MAFYTSFATVLLLLAITAPCPWPLALLGACGAQSIAPLRWFGKTYIAVVRGVPDIAFFLFFVIALDQGFEYLRHKGEMPRLGQPIRQGNDFIVCTAAKLPLGNAPQWVHESYGFMLAVLTFAIVFGAFAANVLFGAMRAVPRPRLETAEAYGMTRRQTFWRVLVPQMWVYALPGLSNLWMVLIKATPLLVSCWASRTSSIGRVNWAAQKRHALPSYPHGNWLMWYFLALLVFYLCFTRLSEIVMDRLTIRLSRGQATAAGDALRKAAL